MIDRNATQGCCIPERDEANPNRDTSDTAGHILVQDTSQYKDKNSRAQCCTETVKTHEHSSAAPSGIDSVSIGGEWFAMGCAQSPHPEDGEGPVRSVWVDQFGLATTAVSNREFQHFVDSTGYQTNAERTGSSFVFHLFSEHLQCAAASVVTPWWRDVSGACWHAPEGSGSSIKGRYDHPVVHVTRRDALQYCQWSGTRLATEAEWECAARGGLVSQPYPWGSELVPAGKHRCNIWQGNFPYVDTGEDGFAGTAPVRQYGANAFGLFNMTGNVWEWVADRFSSLHSPRRTKNPTGPLNGDRFVARGGSYLCHHSYCLRYRTSSRQALASDTSTGNLGFRVAFDVLV